MKPKDYLFHSSLFFILIQLGLPSDWSASLIIETKAKKDAENKKV